MKKIKFLLIICILLIGTIVNAQNVPKLGLINFNRIPLKINIDDRKTSIYLNKKDTVLINYSKYPYYNVTLLSDSYVKGFVEQRFVNVDNIKKYLDEKYYKYVKNTIKAADVLPFNEWLDREIETGRINKDIVTNGQGTYINTPLSKSPNKYIPSNNSESGQYLMNASAKMLGGVACTLIGSAIVIANKERSKDTYVCAGGVFVLGGLLTVSGYIDIGRAGRNLK